MTPPKVFNEVVRTTCYAFYFSFPSATAWDNICYFMLVHCKHAALLNVGCVPLLNPLLWGNNWPFSSPHLLLQNFRRSVTNKPLHHPPPGDSETSALTSRTLVLLIEIYWQSCMSSPNHSAGEGIALIRSPDCASLISVCELEETNRWTGFLRAMWRYLIWTSTRVCVFCLHYDAFWSSSTGAALSAHLPPNEPLVLLFPNFLLPCFLGQKSVNTALPLLAQRQPSAAVTISNTNACLCQTWADLCIFVLAGEELLDGSIKLFSNCADDVMCWWLQEQVQSTRWITLYCTKIAYDTSYNCF